MISDLSLADSSATLTDYYRRLCVAQAEAHGWGYLAVHDEIKRLMLECVSYTELGVNQGATLAAAVLCRPDSVRGYDIALDNYRPARHLFQNYAAYFDIDFMVAQASSLLCAIDTVDLLYIDTIHRRDHLTAELERHAPKVKKYIVCHDTKSAIELLAAIKDFSNRTEWRVVKHCDENTGYTTLAR